MAIESKRTIAISEMTQAEILASGARRRWVAVNLGEGECGHYHHHLTAAGRCATSMQRYFRQKYNSRQTWYVSERLLMTEGEYVMLANLGEGLFLVQRRVKRAPKLEQPPVTAGDGDMPF